ncbi:hypothetical protein M426DRAFT_265732 [Hypoxylon sp. CI-4A]|nr:hypothetical protein M426DRAFT_265732 [Hypoxylon sp. CI-4A]
MSTFHLFPLLPIELRISIWAFAVEPRVVEVRVVPERKTKVQRLISPTPVPAILQACQEARNLGLYKQEFSELTDTVANAAAGAERRYVWLNLDIDMVSIGNCHLDYFVPIALSVKRLKLVRENSDEGFYYFESHRLREWKNTEEILVVCTDGMEAWHKASTEHCWPCDEENLWFFDPDDGRMLRSAEMEKMLDEQLHEYRVQNGWDFENYPEDD